MGITVDASTSAAICSAYESFYEPIAIEDCHVPGLSHSPPSSQPAPGNVLRGTVG